MFWNLLTDLSKSSLERAWAGPRHGCVLAATLIFIHILCGGSAAAQSPPSGYTETVVTESGEKIDIDMVLIPGGSFLMGSPENEPGRKSDEGPEHLVQLEPFYLAATEVTLRLFLEFYRETNAPEPEFFQTQSDQDQVDAITGPTPVYGDMTMGKGKQHPAMGMTWQNAVTFCKWLSEKTGKTYRLPTEAEWEFACLGSSNLTYGSAGTADELSEYAWFASAPSIGTREVATRNPNGYGLYDMLGNVREWVADLYGAESYQEAAALSPAVNPTGATTGRVHVARGGDYRSTPDALRCAARDFEQVWWRAGDPQLPKSKWWLPSMDIIGFRIARSAE